MADINELLHQKKVAARAEDAKPPTPTSYHLSAAGLTDRRGSPYAVIRVPKDAGGFVSKRVYTGDTLPEGNVTGVSAEGLRIIPDEGDEFTIPLGRGDYGEGVKSGGGRAPSPDLSTDEKSQIRADVADLLRTFAAGRAPVGLGGTDATALENLKKMLYKEASSSNLKMLRNADIYKAPNEAAYNDMVNADFARYNENADGDVTDSTSAYDSEVGAMVHSFKRDDGVTVRFAEDDDGNLHNITR